MKRCSKCGVSKPFDDFYKQKKGKHSYTSACSMCMSSQRYKSAGSIVVTKKTCPRCLDIKLVREFYKSKSTLDGYISYCRSCFKIMSTAYRFKISEREVERLRTSLCEICGKNTSICIDHCHKTNKIRGALCSNCNKAIGFLNDNAVLADKVAQYSRRHQ